MKSGILRSALALILAIVVFLAVSRAVDISQNGIRFSRFDLADGKATFQAKCARCHSLQPGVNGVGPSLSSIGKTSATRKPDLTAVGYLLEAILYPNAFKAPGSAGEMPSNLMTASSEDSIRNLVAFLMLQGGSVSDDELAAVAIQRPPIPKKEEVVTKDRLLRGEEIYRSKGGCIVCHSPYARPEFELVAPHIFQGPGRDRQALRKAIIDPHADVAKKFRTISVALTDGAVVSGTLISENDATLTLIIYESGHLRIREIMVSEIDVDADGSKMISTGSESIMPRGFATLLTDDELDCLIDFIRSVN